MSNEIYQVKVIELGSRETTLIGEPTTERRAQKIVCGVSRNLDNDKFYVDYWNIENKLDKGGK